MKSYTTKLRPTTEYTYTAMLSGMDADISEILDHEGFEHEILCSSYAVPDDVPDVFNLHGHPIYYGIVFMKTKVNAEDMKALVEEVCC